MYILKRTLKGFDRFLRLFNNYNYFEMLCVYVLFLAALFMSNPFRVR